MSSEHGPRQRHLKPFKLLCVILFNESDYITWNTDKVVSVRLGPLSRFLSCPNYRTRDYLGWLEQHHYISDLQLNYGSAKFRVNTRTP